MMLRAFVAVWFAAVPVAATAATLEEIVEKTVVFGDSLSDPGFFGIQFTDGDVWATQLGLDTTSGQNFAIGGARAWASVEDEPTVVSFDDQLQLFTDTSPAFDAYDTAVIWFGGNDLLNVSSPFAVPNAVAEIIEGIEFLADSFGVDRFIVPGLPDLGQIPLNLAKSAGDQFDAMMASIGFNSFLFDALSNLAVSTGLDVRYVDTFGLFASILDEDLFDEEQIPCATLPSCDGHLFYDGIHPTEAAHALVAGAIAAEFLAPVPVPPSAPLLAGGLLGLIFLRQRRNSPVAS
ncbi:SGNH/GDSL hydrolase family protein [Ovoidimarina sediminis]|uniref:SGNH/GDSL hydrolase family protein n=1 Tax=Ovoidimarina sediminis TaxID=3079856 RepID=UPI00290FEA14|nr:SGNH/GDSL hydrolase family protein [Rhodophyticola sp. MJ-SS7]MDU8945380.1 SGNH/GDSL hydrolase family protein [Rhodophyticola sp. MJ-SS7]